MSERDTARIEIPRDLIGESVGSVDLDAWAREFQRADFLYVALDLEGLQSGEVESGNFGWDDGGVGLAGRMILVRNRLSGEWGRPPSNSRDLGPHSPSPPAGIFCGWLRAR
ncbi:MAG: hypothetical protein AAGB13_04460 [Cyanobacteria bacterium P01_F01_bin.33]